MWTFMCYFDNAIKIKFTLVVVDFLFFLVEKVFGCLDRKEK